MAEIGVGLASGLRLIHSRRLSLNGRRCRDELKSWPWLPAFAHKRSNSFVMSLIAQRQNCFPGRSRGRCAPWRTAWDFPAAETSPSLMMRSGRPCLRLIRARSPKCSRCSGAWLSAVLSPRSGRPVLDRHDRLTLCRLPPLDLSLSVQHLDQRFGGGEGRPVARSSLQACGAASTTFRRNGAL